MELKPMNFKVGDKVDTKFGYGKIIAVWAQAEAGTDQETEYQVKINGERWPATLGEAGMTKR